MNETGSNFSPASSNFFQPPAAAVEFARGGALKRKDRLLLVADREDRAPDAVARAFAGGEFGNDMARRYPIAAGWCPAPRRSARDRRRGRACNAPSRTRRGPASPASCRSDRHSRAGRAPASRAGNSPPPRSRSAAAPVGAVAGRHRAAPLDQGPMRLAFRIEQARDRRIVVVANFFVTTVLRGVRSSVRNTPRYSSTCALPVNTSASRSRAAWS